MPILKTMRLSVLKGGHIGTSAERSARIIRIRAMVAAGDKLN
jgi:hypothetical protein